VNFVIHRNYVTFTVDDNMRVPNFFTVHLE
jgi:hypothetical protein